MSEQDPQPPATESPTRGTARRWMPVFLVLFALLNIANFAPRGLHDSRPRIDFRTYIEAAGKVAVGENPYTLSWHHAYLYPQFMAFLLIPLTWVEIEEAERIWHYINLGFYLFMIAAAVRWTAARLAEEAPETRARAGAALLLAAVSALGFTPVHFGWRIGQLDLGIGAILAVIFLVKDEWRPVAAGLCVGLGILCKLSPMMLAPALALAFGWRFVAACIAPIAIYVVALVPLGILGNEAYLFGDSLTFKKFNTIFLSNSIYSFVCTSLFPGMVLGADGTYGGKTTTFLTAVLLTGYAISGLWLWWRRAGWFALFAIAVCWGHLASPYMEPHHATNTILVLIPYLALFTARGDRTAMVLAWTAWLIGYLFLPWNETIGNRAAQYSLILVDALLIILALRRPFALGGSGFLLERERMEPVLRRLAPWLVATTPAASSQTQN